MFYLKNILFSGCMIFLVVILISCGAKSPLSDVELSVEDADELTVVATLEKITNTDNEVCVDRIRVRISDKNLAQIHLKNGSIKVNNIVMEEKTDLFGFPYYLIDKEDLAFLPNTTYNFLITFGDGSEFTANITTSSKVLTSFTAPLFHSRSDTLKITWQETGIEGTLYYTKTFQDSSSISSSIDVSNETNATYAFPPSFFENEEFGQVENVYFRLKSAKYGTIDDRFDSDSYIISYYEIQRYVTINN